MKLDVDARAGSAVASKFTFSSQKSVNLQKVATLSVFQVSRKKPLLYV